MPVKKSAEFFNFKAGFQIFYSSPFTNHITFKPDAFIFHFTNKMPRTIVYDEEVENVYCEITDSLKNINIFKQKNHTVHVDTFSYNSARGYSFAGNGYLPLSLTDSIQISARIDGNFLAHLPRIEKFFQKVDLNGHLEVEAYGSLKRPKIEYFDMEVENGSMEFREILKPLTNIKASVHKKRGDPFVKINGISGNFDKYPAWLYNKRQVYADDEKIPTWNFDALGIDLGVAILKTGSEGIPLNIFGLQEKNVYGFFSVNGFNEKEESYFGGPIEEPHARGSVKIRNARVTFPFLFCIRIYCI